MTPLRQRESLQAELASLQALLHSNPDDRIATPLMKGHIAEIQQALRSLEARPPLTPQAGLFFSGGPALDSEGLEVTFTSEILNSYQNMVTNHYAAKHYGTLRYTGRRRGEQDTKLFLTALPRGSFGLQLTQPHVSDFFAANNVAGAMEDIRGLVSSTAESDQAFQTALTSFEPRVFKPLKRFIEALHGGGGTFRLETGFKEVTLTPKKIADAYQRVSAAVADEEVITLKGVFGGVLIFSGDFNFQPEGADMIRGTLAKEVTEQAATTMDHEFTGKPAVARMKVTVVTTSSGKKKPSYELTGLIHLGSEPPARKPKK